MSDRRDYIISFGGSGSKLLTRFLYPNGPASNAGRFHLHTRDPVDAPSAAENFIYIFADPRNAILSFFSRRDRRHERHDFEKSLNMAHRAQPNPEWVRNHLRNLECDPDTISSDWDLSAYLENSMMDVFRLASHFQNWLDYTDKPVLFIRYEALWRHEEKLRDLLGVEQAQLPEFVKRSGNWQEQPAKDRARLDKLVGDLARYQDTLPDIFGRYGQVDVTISRKTVRLSDPGK